MDEAGTRNFRSHNFTSDHCVSALVGSGIVLMVIPDNSQARMRIGDFLPGQDEVRKMNSILPQRLLAPYLPAALCLAAQAGGLVPLSTH